MFMGVYKELGVRKVINASGTMTHLGGSIPDPRVMDAMKEASQSFVVMMELIEKAGKVIAEATGAEAGLVTSGSSAALVLATAACIMRGSDLENFEIQPVERLDLDGDWRDLIQRIPNASWTRNEVIIQKVYRSPYDHAFKVAGGRLVVVGGKDGCSPKELEEAINERTAAIAIILHENLKDFDVPLIKVVEIAHSQDVPVIVDAAMQLPPRENLRKYISEGADLVVFSGGKNIAGPNDTGILCGRKNLIKLATLQSAPYRGIGRAMKVDRTQIVGMIEALRLWLEKDEEKEFKVWLAKGQGIAEALKGLPRVERVEFVKDKLRSRLQIKITLDAKDPSAADIVFNLRKGNPSIWVNYLGSNEIGIDPSLLKKKEDEILVLVMEKMLSGKR